MFGSKSWTFTANKPKWRLGASVVDLSLIQQELGPQQIYKSDESDCELFKHRTMAEDNTS